MSYSNHGNGKNKWNIGHRIARAMYNHNLDEDVRRCWNSNNLFPQWWRSNLDASVKLPSDEELIRLRAYWPTSWNDQLPNTSMRKALEARAKRGAP